MNKILVALDHSQVAVSVLQTAVTLAKQQGAELVLLRAYTLPVDLPMDAYYRPKDDLATVLHKESERELKQLAEHVPTGMKYQMVVELGVPWQVICETAKKENVSLIIMGAHGYRFYERMVGTTAGRVITHADRSVLVVRTPQPAKTPHES